MASLRVVLRKKANKDGTYPLAIRVTKDRKTSFIHLGHHLHAKDWDAKGQKVKTSYPNSKRLNHLILTKTAEANDTLLELETHNKDISSKLVTAEIKPKAATSFFAQADIFVENLRTQGKYNRVLTEQSRIKAIKEFLGNRDVTFPEVNVPLLAKLSAWLKRERRIGERVVKMNERTMMNYLILIRTIYNQAIAANIVDQKHYPFGKGKIAIKFPQSQKVGLSVEDVQKIEALELPLDSYENHARNIWLTSFYFAGMRVSDVLRLKWSDFQNERLYYQMGKNLKVGSLKVPQKVFAILDQYRHQEMKHDLIFPELKVLDTLDKPYHIQRKISYATKRLNTALGEIAIHKDVKITKTLTMHIARHTFGHISGNKIPIQVLKDLYRHSDIKTTMGYQSNFIHEEADNALDAVVGF
ncbi:site-specific integrase [Mucilaginibacter paludis]|uniref:Integrase family protein n=1 Tax=Mucilaginibacter paludis DSM 18603 TaxID=714943 RepID=H1Y3I4_9SPHI|nr:site-specific integrase [Mucilaginibacter paludis]EHQ29752.1 integrase family protein [Mucilaginibacter paludis DSM 18603]